jgi:pimeloyl-ACP methyl ester carboxylesterase
VALALLAVLLAAPAPASALTLRPCAGEPEFGCGTITVPLDHSGRTPGRMRLAVAAERGDRDKPILVALSGGPGQGSVEAIGTFAVTLEPLLRTHRLVVIDQRGTGLSAPLRCPDLQKLDGLDTYDERDMLKCARQIGPRRAFYRTADSVRDLEVLRRAFASPRMALMGISYGTWVAQEYARAYPERTRMLVLDSVVDRASLDGFGANTGRWLPRVLDGFCAGSRCRGATTGFVRDIGTLAQRLDAGRAIRGGVFDTRGRRRAAALTREDELWSIVTTGDFNPNLFARLPGAIAAAAGGDPAPLLRLRRPVEGPPNTPVRAFSTGLFLTTTCLDGTLPYDLTSDPAGRPAAIDAAFAAIPPAYFRPFSARMTRGEGAAQLCRLFPRQAAPRPPIGRLPKVRTLMLAGRDDMRTPLEQAQAVQREIPGSRIVVADGIGHDVIDSDTTGCAARAMRRFAAGQAVGQPCRGKTKGIPVLPRPPRSLAQVPRAGEIAGERGRVVRAALDTAQEAAFSAVEAVFSGFSASAGGLRGGSVRGDDAFAGTLRLSAYSYVPGVRLSGDLDVLGNSLRGRLRVDGPVSGSIVFAGRNRVSGVLGGRAFRYAKPAGRGASAADLTAIPPIPPAVLARLRDRAAPAVPALGR